MAAAAAVPPVHPFDCFSTLIDRHGAAAFIDNEEFKSLTRQTKFSNSKPLDSKVWGKDTRRTKSSLKSHVRAGVEPQLRRQYWLAMLQVNDEDVILYSRAIGQPDDSFSPPSPTHCLPLDPPVFSQGPNFKSSYKRLSHFLSTGATLVPVLSHFLLHFLEEWECYVGVLKLLQRQAWIDRNRVEEKASRLTLMKLITSHLKSLSLSVLKPVGMGESVFVDELLSLWSLWPFYVRSFWIIVRVLDLYLLEGPKIFYRFALLAVKHFVSSSGFENYKTSQLPLGQYIPHFISTLSLEETCKIITEGIALPHLSSWDAIFKNWLLNCSIAEQQSLSSPLSLSLSPTPAVAPGGAEVMANGGQQKQKRKFSLGSSSSEILDQEMVDELVEWFPDWAFGDTLECLFQASKNGYNLRTLFHKCEHEEPLVLIIKTLKESVFGAFIATPLTERTNNSFFGSGETFLFTLKPHPQVFQWTAESDLVLRANDEEIIIGSGGGHYGLWIDGDLYRGSTATCAAYNNPPLTGSGSEDFYCSAIEVFKISWLQQS